ncbi:MAG: RecX family transcriptional regulator [Ruminococcus sp.]|nr:RecX family transcriptional regulator [Ruminococcus sp.]
MEVTGLKKYKGTTYEIEIDNQRKIYLHIDTITDFGIARGMELDRETLRKIIYASNFRRAYQYSLYCLDYRDYSAEEIYEKLMKTYKSEKLCLDVVRKLARADIINDKRYAEKLAGRYVESKKYGFKRAKREIVLKGIDEDTADEALSHYDGLFYENLVYLIESKYCRQLEDKKDRKEIEKVKGILFRYGYNFDDINRAIREYFKNADLSED